MPGTKRAEPRTEITGLGWKKAISICSNKLAEVSRAILTSLTSDPMSFCALVYAVPASRAWLFDIHSSRIRRVR